MYTTGHGIPQDKKKAFEWYKKAAEQGNAYAQTALGLMYAYGQRVTQDDRKAVEWYKKAAEQQNMQAQLYLGSMYLDGRGVNRSLPKLNIKVHSYKFQQ
jgi:TPR repeat protein